MLPIWFRCLYLFLCLSTALSASEDKSREGQRLYDDALEAYRKDRIADTVRLLKIVIQKEPKHKEALSLLGTIYYQNQKLRKARAMFERSDVSSINSETAFAWGATYLQFGDYDKAIPGLRYVVKNRGIYRDFAIYYLGVIYYKKGQWSRSRRFFQSVDTAQLPVFLRINRRKYLSEIRRQQDKMLETVLSATEKRNADLVVIEPAEEIGLDADSPAPDEQLAAPSKTFRQVNSPMPVSAWRWSWKPSLSAVQQTSLLDNHGLNNDTVDLIAHREEMNASVSYQPARERAGFSAFLQFGAGLHHYEARVQKTRYFKLEQSSGFFTTLEKSKESEQASFAHVQSSLGWGPGESWRLELGGAFHVLLPDSDEKKAWGQGTAQTAIRYEGDATELGLEVALQKPFDDQLKKNSQDLGARLEIERDWSEVRFGLIGYHWETDTVSYTSRNRFRYVLADPQLRYRVGFQTESGGSGHALINVGEFSLELKIESYQREVENQGLINRISNLDNIETAVNGAEKALGSVSVPIWDFLTVTGAVGFNRLRDYLYTERDQDGNLVKNYLTDVEQSVFQLNTVLSFADWIRLAGNYTVSNNKYLAAEAKLPEFLRKNPDYGEDSSIYLELGKSF
jgi:tetratricopeptide (TPR) repeat protein